MAAPSAPTTTCPIGAPKRPATRGVAEGEALADILGAPARALPWNKAFAGEHAVTPGEGGLISVAGKRGLPRITLLSPTPERLDLLFRVWDRELEKLHVKKPAKPKVAAPALRGRLDIEAMANTVTSVDRAPANGSSMAFLVEHGGASVLLGADAYPHVLAPALRELTRSRGLATKLEVDALKLSHHGSRANVTTDLLRAVQADHYVVSNNNTIFNHPDDEAVARVLVHGGAEKTLWFNYGTERNRKWAATDLQARYGYDARHPDPRTPRVSLAL
jgi:hypothetical protein